MSSLSTVRQSLVAGIAALLFAAVAVSAAVPIVPIA